VLAVDKQQRFEKADGHMLRRLWEKPGLLFVFVFAFKLALLIFTSQPVPANDAFFYDGPVVNYLLNGKYTNPSLALTLPISGQEFFSAYPPLYQALLMGWMNLAGTSALSAMWLHLFLFGGYMLVLFALLRRLAVPIWALHIAAAFLLTIPTHDRPDSLGHLLGIVGIYAWLCGSDSKRQHWTWVAAGVGILGFFTGPVLGALYLSILGCLIVGTAWTFKDLRFALPIAAMLLVPAIIVYAIAQWRPELWVGFMEHARQTPSLSKLHPPQIAELIKIVRTTPGILAVAALTSVYVVQLRRRGVRFEPNILLAGSVTLLASIGVVLACLLALTANFVHVTAYFQPIVVGCCLTAFVPTFQLRRQQLVQGLFWSLALFAGIRSIGQATWGVACAADVNYSKALSIVQRETDSVPDARVVVYSSAFLYEAARHTNVNWIHSDWLGPIKRGETFSFPDAVIKLKPAKLILTQFDYYRRYDKVVAELRAKPELVEISISDAARVRPPDSYPSLQRVTQHVSWAPIVISFRWKTEQK
jgi:hypothetical protein